MTPWPTQTYSFVAMLRDEINAGGSPLYGMAARKVVPAVVPTLVAPAKQAQFHCDTCRDTGTMTHSEYYAGAQHDDIEASCIDCDGGMNNPNVEKEEMKHPAEFRPFSEVPEKDGVYEVENSTCKIYARFYYGIWRITSQDAKLAATYVEKSTNCYDGTYKGWREIQEQK